MFGYLFVPCLLMVTPVLTLPVAYYKLKLTCNVHGPDPVKGWRRVASSLRLLRMPDNVLR